MEGGIWLAGARSHFDQSKLSMAVSRWYALSDRRLLSPFSSTAMKPVHRSSQPSAPPHLTKLTHLRQISDLWDRALGIPGTRWRVGLESIVGLLPFGGDFIGLLLSSYIVFQSLEFGLPRTILFRMLFNIILDAAVGSVPILGDLFDTTWKANTKNVNLLEAHLASPEASRQADYRFIWFLGGSIVLVGSILLTLLVLFITLIMKMMHS